MDGFLPDDESPSVIKVRNHEKRYLKVKKQRKYTNVYIYYQNLKFVKSMICLLVLLERLKTSISNQ